MQELNNNLQPEIIFDDAEVLVLNKPAGLVVHSDGRTKEYTLADWLVEKYPDIKDIGEPWEARVKGGGTITIPRPGIVHRLDRETSGVIMVAKTQESYESLKNQFKERQVQKEYRVILNGTFKDEIERGTIDKPIGKSPSDFRKWSAQPGARGALREALTEYEIISRVGVGNDGYAYISAKPHTGRTHQIRVHLKAIHHSVLGDKLYGAKRVHNIGTKVPRTMLHAHSLSFKNLSGETGVHIANIPQDFKQVLDSLGL
jgi:23S rRNA pseudouridine1911/1915/1917 synthase